MGAKGWRTVVAIVAVDLGVMRKKGREDRQTNKQTGRVRDSQRLEWLVYARRRYAARRTL